MRSPRRLRSHTQSPVKTSSIGTMPVADIAIWPAVPNAVPLCNGNSQCMKPSPAVRVRGLRSIIISPLSGLIHAIVSPSRCTSPARFR